MVVFLQIQHLVFKTLKDKHTDVRRRSGNLQSAQCRLTPSQLSDERLLTDLKVENGWFHVEHGLLQRSYLKGIQGF